MRVIDAHVHLYPAEINRDPAGWAETAGEAHWARLCTRQRKNGRPVQAFPSVDELLRTMDAAGVDEAILLGWYWETPAACEWQNAFYAEVIAMHPRRFRACATVHPAMAAQPGQLVADLADRGFVGLGELSPHSVGAADVLSPWWDELFAAAGEAGLPVNLHVTDPKSRWFPGRVETPLDDFIGWARRHPATTFVLAHGGGRLPWLRPEILRCRNVHFDLAAFPLLYPPPELDAWVAQVGAGRLLWGTDTPLDLYPRNEAANSMREFRAELMACGFGDETNAALFGDNAAAVFRRR